MIGWFAACSDVTSVVHEDLNLTALLHMHGALSIWDYTRIAPYANIDFNPEVKNSSKQRRN